MIDLDGESLNIIKTILREHVPGATVFAFGSRVNGTPKPYSDLDLAIKGERALSFSQMGELRRALQESTVAIRVDIADWHAMSEEFRGVVSAACERLI